jgi:hypothetical protein
MKTTNAAAGDRGARKDDPAGKRIDLPNSAIAATEQANRYFDDRLRVWVTRCPPGKALGADDLANWGRRRARGWSGSDGWEERCAEKRWREGRRDR